MGPCYYLVKTEEDGQDCHQGPFLVFLFGSDNLFYWGKWLSFLSEPSCCLYWSHCTVLLACT